MFQASLAKETALCKTTIFVNLNVPASNQYVWKMDLKQNQLAYDWFNMQCSLCKVCNDNNNDIYIVPIIMCTRRLQITVTCKKGVLLFIAYQYFTSVIVMFD